MGPIELLDQETSDRTLVQALSSFAYSFLQPPPSLHAAALAATKTYVDPVATATSKAQEQRQQLERRKRKRGQADHYDSKSILRLKQIHLEGFDIDQVWAQVRRALDANRRDVERSLRELQKENQTARLESQPLKSALKKSSTRASNGVHFRDDGGSDLDNVESANEKGVELSELQSMEDGMEDYDMDEIEEDEDQLGAEADLEEASNDENAAELNEEGLESLDGSEEQPTDVFVPDKNGLNDGFFSIDDFNKQADFMEQQDARGENDGAASDEEDIDWTTDPLSKSFANRDHDEIDAGQSDASEDEEDGPTFGNVDLNGPDVSEDDHDVSAADLATDTLDSMENTNAVKYADFFEPPPRKLTKAGGRNCALPKTQPPPPEPGDQDADIQRTMAAARRDIFEDDLSLDEDEALSNPEDRRSSHQKRQAALTTEIRRLEAAALQKRDWTLSGEARAADRPLNSLLEEDLDFERVGKPVPVITQEVSEDIETLIKRRILAREFDEVIRRRPSNLATGGGNDGQRRGMFELSSSKPEQSLAEVYEAEHLQKMDPAGHPSKADQKLAAEHKKIEVLWKDVSAKLDALSSWHYRPKPPSAEVSVVADVATISMEDARPAGVGGDVGVESMLAPQEIYKAGENRDKAKEVVTGSGMPVGRDELTREEKLRRRRRAKEKIRKSGEGVGVQKGEVSSGQKKADERKSVIQDLKRGGVKVIGKKGDIRDVEGNTVKGQGQQLGKGAGRYKL